MNSRISEAIILASTAHKGQVRKYTEEPYIAHPFAVAGLVASVSFDEDMIIAALLHDVVEDTDVSIDMIEDMFGHLVAGMVSDLTDVSKPEDGNRAKRKKIDRLHTATASPKAKTIKLADLIDNTKTITVYDPNFAKVYMREKRMLLKVLSSGDEKLFSIAERMLLDYFKVGGYK